MCSYIRNVLGAYVCEARSEDHGGTDGPTQASQRIKVDVREQRRKQVPTNRVSAGFYLEVLKVRSCRWQLLDINYTGKGKVASYERDKQRSIYMQAKLSYLNIGDSSLMWLTMLQVLLHVATKGLAYLNLNVDHVRMNNPGRWSVSS